MNRSVATPVASRLVLIASLLLTPSLFAEWRRHQGFSSPFRSQPQTYFQPQPQPYWSIPSAGCANGRCGGIVSQPSFAPQFSGQPVFAPQFSGQPIFQPSFSPCGVSGCQPASGSFPTPGRCGAGVPCGSVLAPSAVAPSDASPGVLPQTITTTNHGGAESIAAPVASGRRPFAQADTNGLYWNHISPDTISVGGVPLPTINGAKPTGVAWSSNQAFFKFADGTVTDASGAAGGGAETVTTTVTAEDAPTALPAPAPSSDAPIVGGSSAADAPTTTVSPPQPPPTPKKAEVALPQEIYLTSVEAFDKFVATLKPGKIVVATISSIGCGHCKTLHSELDAMSPAERQNVVFVTIGPPRIAEYMKHQFKPGVPDPEGLFDGELAPSDELAARYYRWRGLDPEKAGGGYPDSVVLQIVGQGTTQVHETRDADYRTFVQRVRDRLRNLRRF